MVVNRRGSRFGTRLGAVALLAVAGMASAWAVPPRAGLDFDLPPLPAAPAPAAATPSRPPRKPVSASAPLPRDLPPLPPPRPIATAPRLLPTLPTATPIPATRVDPQLRRARAAAEDPPEPLPLPTAARRKLDELIEPDANDDVPLEVPEKRSKLLRTKRDVFRTVITDPSIVDVVQFGPKEIAILGKLAGTTNVTLWFDDQVNGQTLNFVVTVVADEAAEVTRQMHYRDLERRIGQIFPGSKIHLLVVGKKVIVKGSAKDITEATRIYDLVKSQSGQLDTTDAEPGSGRGPGALPTPANPMVVGGRAAGAPNDAMGAPGAFNAGAPGVGMSAGPIAPGGNGAVDDTQGDSNSDSNVVNLIEVPGEAQVMLKVRIAQLKRTALRNIGLNFQINPKGKLGEFFFNSSLATSSNPVAVFSGDEVSLLIHALTQNSTMKLLAEPNLVTLSGRPASFLSGGSFPVPTVVTGGTFGAVGSSFQGYGTQLQFTPTVLDKDRIRLQVTPSYSELDRTNAVNGIPALTLSTAFATVDLRAGQWLAIAGLRLDKMTAISNRIPALGDVPLLGRLFSNNSMNREENELIVLVSPVLVHPLDHLAHPPPLPGMEVTEPDDWDFYALGRWEGRPDIQYRSTVGPLLPQRTWEFKPAAAADSYYIQGPQGFSR